MNGIAFLLACVVLLMVGDRVRLMNWRTARPLANVLSLCQAGIALWVLWDSCTATVAAYQWLALVAVALRLLLTMHAWSRGMPKHVQTGVGGLGPPELERYK